MEKKRILVADRDDDVSNSIGEYLQDEYKIYKICDGKEIISTIESQNIDLIITDIEVSNVYFYNLVADIKSQFPDIPVIVMYVYCDYTQEMENTIRKLTDAIFLKPFDLYELRKRISFLLNNRGKNQNQNDELRVN